LSCQCSPCACRAAGAMPRALEDCTCTACMMAQMFKQRILFQSLVPEQQDNCARVLAKRGEDAQGGGNIGEAMRVLFLGTAWLRGPERIYPSSQPASVDPQTYVRLAVRDALETIGQSPVDMHARMAPALHILQELLQASTINLHDAEGSPDWVRISYATRKVSKRKLCQAEERCVRPRTDPCETDSGSVLRGAGGASASSSRRQAPEDAEADLERGLTGRKVAMQTKAKSGKPIVLQRIKQSGIQGVSWKETMGSWSVTFCHPETGKNTGKQFSVTRMMSESGVSWDEADEMALQASIAFRHELVKKKILAPATRQLSRVQGVSWSTTNKCWNAWIMEECFEGFDSRSSSEGNWVKREFHPLTPSPEDFDMARKQAELCRKQWEHDAGVEIVQAHAKTTKELSTRKSGVPGISWDKWGECWHVDVTMPSGRVQRRFRPEGITNEAIEEARQDAARCREALLEEKKKEQEEHEAAVAAVAAAAEQP